MQTCGSLKYNTVKHVRYAGEACDLCADGFVRSKGLCVFQAIRGPTGQAAAGPGTAPALPPARAHLRVFNKLGAPVPSTAFSQEHSFREGAQMNAQGSVAAPALPYHPLESPTIDNIAPMVPSHAPHQRE
jgi:hypothetical protein